MGTSATGPALIIPFTIGTSQIVGQGNYPIVRARYALDDVSVSTPAWKETESTRLRGFEISRGRESELDEVNAGTAVIKLDNRDRAFDPNITSGLRPLNRWWIYEEFSGEVRDLFRGYAESYDNQWPDPLTDAVCVVNCADEFKVLSEESLPTTNPPRDSYQSLVSFENPVGYWPMGEDPSTIPVFEEPQGSQNYTVLEPLNETSGVPQHRRWRKRRR